MKQVLDIPELGIRKPGIGDTGALILVLGLMWAGCSQSGANDSGGNGDEAPPAVAETQKPGAADTESEAPAVSPAESDDASPFDKEAAVAESRRQDMDRPAPEVAEAPSGDAGEPGVDTSQLSAAPAWVVPNLQGSQVTNADFAGKVVILDFWATWCGPCKMEIPHFKELYSEYKSHGLEIVGVAVGEPPAKVGPFVQQAGINYHTVLGTRQMVSDYGPINGIPTTFIISQDGKIFRRYVGYRPKSTFEQDVRALLGMTG